VRALRVSSGERHGTARPLPHAVGRSRLGEARLSAWAKGQGASPRLPCGSTVILSDRVNLVVAAPEPGLHGYDAVRPQRPDAHVRQRPLQRLKLPGLLTQGRGDSQGESGRKTNDSRKVGEAPTHKKRRPLSISEQSRSAALGSI
jgi:hypothetical protein